MKPKIRAIIISLILFVTITLDQITKKVAHTCLAGSEPISFFHNFFVLQYAENTGGFLGMGASISESLRFWVFSVLVALFLLILFVYLVFSKGFTIYQIFALSAILGGGIGNLIDRLLNEGRVVDFMNFGIGSRIRTGILNVADLFITFGAIFLFWFLLIENRKENRVKRESQYY
ncbi:MAG: signal peptidase II [Desulfobacteraceae bacterium]|jgi:signal peptidase II